MNQVSTFSIPTRIESQRLILRMFQHADWLSLHEHYGDEECTRFTLGRVLTEGESWRAMASMVGHWLLRGYGPYALQEKSTGTVVGTTGLWYPIDFPECEIKWALTRRHWGKGYAKEAAQAVQSVARQHLADTPPISLIHRDNVRSIKVAVSVGATFEREIDFRAGRFQIYRHPSGPHAAGG